MCSGPHSFEELQCRLPTRWQDLQPSVPGGSHQLSPFSFSESKVGREEEKKVSADWLYLSRDWNG